MFVVNLDGTVAERHTEGPVNTVDQMLVITSQLTSLTQVSLDKRWYEYPLSVYNEGGTGTAPIRTFDMTVFFALGDPFVLVQNLPATYWLKDLITEVTGNDLQVVIGPMLVTCQPENNHHVGLTLRNVMNMATRIISSIDNSLLASGVARESGDRAVRQAEAIFRPDNNTGVDLAG